MLNTKRYFMLMAAMILVLTAVTPVLANSVSTGHSTNINQEDGPIKIGVLTDHSGALQSYGFEQTQGFMLGLEYATGGTMEVAGRPIEVVERDNGGDNDTALDDTRVLVEEEGVDILFGTVSSTVTLNVQAAAAEYEIMHFAGPSAAPQITGTNFSEYTFRTCRNSFQDAYTVGRYSVDNYGSNYVQLAPDTAFGQGSAIAFDIAAAALEATPVRDTVLFADGTTDFTDLIIEVRDSGADFVYVTCAGATCVNLFSQIADLDLKSDVPVMTGFNSNTLQELLQTNTVGDVGLIVYHYTLPDNEVNDFLIERHMEEYGTPPDLFSECGFATAQALVAALEATEGDPFPEAMIPALEGMEFAGPKGDYLIRAEDHQALMPMYIVEMVTLEPEEPFAFYELLGELTGEDTAPPCLAAGRSSESLTCPE